MQSLEIVLTNSPEFKAKNLSYQELISLGHQQEMA
jgi:hypothetical protein